MQSKVFPIKPETAITKVVLEWTPQTGNINNCPNQSSSPNAGVLPPAGSWTCPYGALRVDLTNTSTGLNRTALAQNTFSGVLMPTRTAGSGNVAFNGKNAFGGNSASQGTRSAAICSSTSCRMEIQFSGANANEYYMRLSTLYVNTQVTISAVNGTTPVSLKDAQILIDSTGKAQDILRRIQVRIPLVNDGIHADYGLQSKESICKAFTAYRPDDPNYSNNSSCP